MAAIEKEKLKQVFVLATLVFLGLFLFLNLFPFVGAFLGAVIFYIILRPLFYFLSEKKKWNKSRSALLVMLISFLVLLLPVFTVLYMLSDKIGYLFNHSNEIMQGLRSMSLSIKEYAGVDIFSEEKLTALQEQGAALIPSVLSNVLEIFSSILFMYFILYFMLTSSRKMEATIFEYMPFTFEDNDLLADELRKMTISNAIGIPLLGSIQAIFAIIGFWIFGLPEPVFWGVITGFMSVVPMFGTMIVWIPLGIYLYGTGMHWQGIALLIYGGAVIMNVDNVFRFMLAKKMADVHPLITVFGVIIGIKLFGFVGLIFGPLLLSYFLLLIKIYRGEYVVNKK